MTSPDLFLSLTRTDFPGYLIGITVLGIVVPSVIGVLVGIIVCVCYKRNRKSHTVSGALMNYFGKGSSNTVIQ